MKIFGSMPLYALSIAQVCVFAHKCDAQQGQSEVRSNASISTGADLTANESVPREIRAMYESGLQFLQKTQSDNGSWSGGEVGPGTTGLAVLALLASGEDPNYGPYTVSIRKALQSILRSQDVRTGYLGPSMYHHGFATLALAEAYGSVDESQLFIGEDTTKRIAIRSLGESLELAVRCAVTSQKKNPHHAWRYSPNTKEADTSVSGAVLMGLLAARNAGIEVPDSSIDQAIAYFVSMSSNSGAVGYTSSLEGFGDSMARSSIATLVFCIAKRRDVPTYTASLNKISSDLESIDTQWPEYTRYYRAQALYQGDVTTWEKWNRILVRRLKEIQAADGSFKGSMGVANDTSMALLALALNFKLLPIYER
jgi:hypothetical protein